MAESGDGGTKLPLAEVERVGGCLPPTKAVVGEFLASKSAAAAVAAAVAAAAAAVVAVLMTISCFVSLTPPLPPMLFRLIFIFRPLLLSTVAWCSTCEEEVEFFPAEEEEEEDEVAPSDAGEAVEAEAVPPTTGDGAANGLPEELLVPRW